ncbi:MAG: tRNA (guanosine(37)-N1)-methyltransferase TrmD [Planctomycetota bacterium]|nr:tRNA (guanosine(37)-N1)-methyltransferase TrmD [Planctomycetota bacterium]
MTVQLEIDVFTLFPEVFEPFLSSSMLGIARRKGLVVIRVHDLREWGKGKRRQVDDTPYGGGAGMVIMPDVVVSAVEDVVKDEQVKVVFLAPSGVLFTQQKAFDFARSRRLALVCGHYEAIDERASLILNAEEVSIGDYVTSGGEAPAMVVIDAVVRLVPGVLGNVASLLSESFSEGLLEHPHYTRPYEFRGLKVPDVLLSGDHKKIAEWRRKESLRRTKERRYELYERYGCSEEDGL